MSVNKNVTVPDGRPTDRDYARTRAHRLAPTNPTRGSARRMGLPASPRSTSFMYATAHRGVYNPQANRSGQNGRHIVQSPATKTDSEPAIARLQGDPSPTAEREHHAQAAMLGDSAPQGMAGWSARRRRRGARYRRSRRVPLTVARLSRGSWVVQTVGPGSDDTYGLVVPDSRCQRPHPAA